MDIEKKKELWDRLKNESERAYRAFECFRNLPGAERTLIEAYRQHVGNPGAAKPSDTWSRWSNQFAWRERTADLESEDFVQQMRPQDVINIVRLHFEATQKLEDTNTQTPDSGVDWSEDEQRELDRILDEIESEEAQEEPEEGSEVSEEGSEESEDDQDK